MEQVSDAQYRTPIRGQGASPNAGAQPRPSQRAIGNFAPKLAELTDDVLYGDVWERPQLSKRDRSLVTVAALIALNRPDQLRSHLVRARENGVTQEELIETITHMVLRGLAQRGDRHRSGQGSLREEMMYEGQEAGTRGSTCRKSESAATHTFRCRI